MKPELLEKPNAIVTVGPLHCQAIAPYSRATGPVRAIGDIELAHNDADALAALFAACPRGQWGAAAQAGMSIRGNA